MPAGRPTDYTQELADLICQRLMDGESLRQICDDENMPGRTTVFRWLASDEVFRNQYAQAREAQAEAMADEMLDIADDGRNDWMERRGEEDAGWVTNGENIQRSRLRIDTRKWVAAKLLPKKYGDKISVGGDKENPIQTESTSDRELAKALAAILAKGLNGTDRS